MLQVSLKYRLYTNKEDGQPKKEKRKEAKRKTDSESRGGCNSGYLPLCMSTKLGNEFGHEMPVNNTSTGNSKCPKIFKNLF